MRLEDLKVLSDPVQVLQPLVHREGGLSVGNIVSEQTLKDFGCILSMLALFYPSDYAIVGLSMCWHREFTGDSQRYDHQ